MPDDRQGSGQRADESWMIGDCASSVSVSLWRGEFVDAATIGRLKWSYVMIAT